jgi:hypothetical protein
MLPIKRSIVDNDQKGSTEISNQDFGPLDNLSPFPKIVAKSSDDSSILAFDSSSIGHLDFKAFST